MAEVSLIDVRADDAPAGNCLRLRQSRGILQIFFQSRHVVVLFRLKRDGFFRGLLKMLAAVNTGKHTEFLFECLHKSVAVGKAGIRRDGFDGRVGM